MARYAKCGLKLEIIVVGIGTRPPAGARRRYRTPRVNKQSESHALMRAFQKATPHSDCEFIVSAAEAPQFPPETAGTGEAVEFAFLGRSNVGKSTLLNALARQPGLAFTSARPGCTQSINFFRVDDRVRFVDLPGYGYAQVSLKERAGWKRIIESYLLKRQCLALSFLVIDARRAWMEMDLELKAWLEFHKRRYQVVVTKIDKLKGNELKNGLAAVQNELMDQEPVPFSALDGRGVREIWQIISKIKNK